MTITLGWQHLVWAGVSLMVLGAVVFLGYVWLLTRDRR